MPIWASLMSGAVMFSPVSAQRSSTSRTFSAISASVVAKTPKPVIRGPRRTVWKPSYWLLGTHHGAVSAKYLQRYLDEYVFRFNRRRAKSPAHGFARVLQNAVRLTPATHRDIVAAGTT